MNCSVALVRTAKRDATIVAHCGGVGQGQGGGLAREGGRRGGRELGEEGIGPGRHE